MLGGVSSLIDDPDARRDQQPTISVEPTLAIDPGSPGSDAEEIRALRAELDEVTQQLLVARDAALGADAERSVARARVSELEHHLHVREVEVEELTERLRMLNDGNQNGPTGAGELARRAGSVGRRAAGRVADRVVGRLNEQVTGR